MFMRTSRSSRRLFAPVLAALMLVTSSSAQAYVARGTTRTNVNTGNVNRNVNVNTGNVNANRVNVNTGNVNANRNVNVNTGNVNVNRNVNVSGGCCYNNVGVGGAVAGCGDRRHCCRGRLGVAASALPPSCSTAVVNGLAYQNCGGAWYQPQYAGSQVTYIVVNPPM
jgi:hypothetical protein